MKFPYMVKYNGIVYRAGMDVPDSADVAGIDKPVAEVQEEKAEEIVVESAPKKRGRPSAKKE